MGAYLTIAIGVAALAASVFAIATFLLLGALP